MAKETGNSHNDSGPYQAQTAEHSAPMPKSAKGGEFSKMKSLRTTNPAMKSSPKGGNKDGGAPYNTANPKGTERSHRGDSVGKNPAHGY